ncbi:MAG: hypothetical protein K0V04_02955 [Deltaproteobacteria bacterium]|nr:hypothetical protein [Deltaproteobacteria bacterium]
MRWGLVGLGVGVGIVVLMTVGARPAQASTPNVGGDGARVDVRELARDAGLPEVWGDFFALVAHGESRNNPHAVNDSPTEARRSAEAFASAANRFERCGHPPEAYSWGSGGLFGHIPTTAFAQLREGRCLSPEMILDPRVSLAAAVGFARGLMKWKRYAVDPTFHNLRAMWKWPAKGGDPDFLAERRPKYDRHAAVVGLPPSFLDQTPPPLPMTGDEVLDRLGVAVP